MNMADGNKVVHEVVSQAPEMGRRGDWGRRKKKKNGKRGWMQGKNGTWTKERINGKQQQLTIYTHFIYTSGKI